METLDNIHSSKMREINNFDIFENEKLLFSLRLKQKDPLYSSDWLSLTTEINKLEIAVNDAKSGRLLRDYYMNAGDVLFQYYNAIDNIDSMPLHVNETKNGILSYLTDSATVSIEEEVSSDIPFKSASREELRQTYLQKVQTSLKITKKKPVANLNNELPMCKSCNNELAHIYAEGIVECQKCGEMQSIITDVDKSAQKDQPKDSCYYSYRRVNHFNEWIAQFQGKETTQIPRQVLVQIVQEIKKERIMNLSELSIPKVRAILKKLKLNKYYEHIPFIINQLNGKQPPFMSRQTEEILRIMFQKIQGPFLAAAPRSRKNFLSYSYVLHKFVELLGMDHLKPLFPLLKSREKLHQQDQIWRKICEETNWEFNKSM
jgi:hypothetical protein